MAENEYTRLTWARPRSRFGVFFATNSSLWLGKDHLLCIDTSGYTESYKRFYFRDIQALLLRVTDRHRYWSLALSVLMGLCLLPIILSSDIVARYVFGVLDGLFLAALLLNVAFGPASSCHILTAVQLESLPSLNRLRRARRVFARLHPLIIAAQGETRQQESPPGPLMTPEAILPVSEPEQTSQQNPQSIANPESTEGI